jgi:hypothetical protein
MKAVSLAILLLAVNASAQILRQIDMNQMSDYSGKQADVQTLQFDTVDKPTRTEATAPQSSKMLEKAASVGNKQADLPGMVPLEMYPTKTIPHQNFAAKRAVLPDNTPSTKPLKNEQADINKRVIKPFTPTGAEELKDQLSNQR